MSVSVLQSFAKMLNKRPQSYFCVALSRQSMKSRSNISKTRKSISSRVPNTEKQMKARGRKPTAFICFEAFGTRDEARSPSCVINKNLIKMEMFDLR